MDALQPGCFVLVKNNNRVNKEDPLYKGPFRVLPPRADHSQHMYELENMVEDIIDTVHMRNIVPLIGMTKDVALNAARVIAQEFEVTACLGYDGDPLKPGSLYFSLQFDNQPEVYPTLFRDCKMCPPVRDFIKGIVSDNPESNFKRLITLLRKEAPKRRRKRDQLLSDLG